jgi:hypothetical protein
LVVVHAAKFYWKIGFSKIMLEGNALHVVDAIIVRVYN